MLSFTQLHFCSHSSTYTRCVTSRFVFLFLVFFVPVFIFTRYVKACLNFMQQLPSSGAVIRDQIQLSRAETAAAAKSTRTPPHHTRAAVVCVWYVVEVEGVCVCVFLMYWGQTLGGGGGASVSQLVHLVTLGSGCWSISLGGDCIKCDYLFLKTHM